MNRLGLGLLEAFGLGGLGDVVVPQRRPIWPTGVRASGVAASLVAVARRPRRAAVHRPSLVAAGSSPLLQLKTAGSDAGLSSVDDFSVSAHAASLVLADAAPNRYIRAFDETAEEGGL